MATRQSVEDHIHRAEQAVHDAEKQLTIAKKQEHYNESEYTKAQMQLEEVSQQLEHLLVSANTQQVDQIHRAHLLVQQTQQHMILNYF